MWVNIESNGLSGRLYHVDEMPEHFHEKFIVKGYRHPKSTPYQCLLSVFDATNETLNFWTHFLPSIYFMWVLRDLYATLDLKSDPYLWPLLVYLCMCCLFPLASCTAHTFNTMSDNARHICFFMDYSAISLTSISVAIAYRAYAFPAQLRHSVIGDLYIPIAMVNSLLCIVISCKTRLMRPTAFRKYLRTGAFALPCLYDIVPVVYRLACGTEDEMKLSSWTPHCRGVILLFVSGFLYSSHFPERLFPGHFDIIGHSHQLFHVCSILGTMEQMQAILNDVQERREELSRDWEFSSPGSSVGLICIGMVVNSLVIAIFSYMLYHSGASNSIEKKEN